MAGTTRTREKGQAKFLQKGCVDTEFSSKNVKRGQNGMSLFSQTAQAQV
jgi:hypothetical protein